MDAVTQTRNTVHNSFEFSITINWTEYHLKGYTKTGRKRKKKVNLIVWHLGKHLVTQTRNKDVINSDRVLT